MAILPAASLSQIAQLGVAAETAGSYVAANVAGFLGALSETLAGVASSGDGNQAGHNSITVGQPQAESVGGADLAVLRRQLETLVATFRTQLHEVLAGGGIDSSQPFSVTLDESGLLHASKDHPDAQQIDNLIGGNSTLTDLFRAIQARGQLLGANAANAHGTTANPLLPPANG